MFLIFLVNIIANIKTKYFKTIENLLLFCYFSIPNSLKIWSILPFLPLSCYKVNILETVNSTSYKFNFFSHIYFIFRTLKFSPSSINILFKNTRAVEKSFNLTWAFAINEKSFYIISELISHPGSPRSQTSVIIFKHIPIWEMQPE